MDAKEYLQQYGRLGREIRQLQEEKRVWQELALHITPTYSRAPGGGGVNKIQAALEKAEQWEEKIAERILVLSALREEIEASLSLVADPDLQTVLRMRYILGYTQSRTAEEMHYCEQWIRRLQSRALAALDEALESAD